MRKNRKLLFIPVVVALFVIGNVGVASADFVCPVFEAGSAPIDHNKNLIPIAGGDYTIFPGKAGVAPGGVGVDYPDQATNLDGTGDPGGTHAAPGDPGYSPLWNTNG